MQTNQQQEAAAAAPDIHAQPDGSGAQWYTLKEAAQLLHKSKSALDYHASKLGSADRRTDAGGVIRISAAAVDTIRAKCRASAQQVPNKYQTTNTSTQQAPEKHPTSAQQVPENGLSGTQEAAADRPTSTQQVPNSAAEKAALDALNEIIRGLQAELKEERSAKLLHMEKADALRLDIARLEAQEKAAIERAERAEQEAAEQKAQNQALTEQLAQIADKQADALRAGAAEQLAIAAKQETEPEQPQQRRGLLARLFHRKSE